MAGAIGDDPNKPYYPPPPPPAPAPAPKPSRNYDPVPQPDGADTAEKIIAQVAQAYQAPAATYQPPATYKASDWWDAAKKYLSSQQPTYAPPPPPPPISMGQFNTQYEPEPSPPPPPPPPPPDRASPILPDMQKLLNWTPDELDRESGGIYATDSYADRKAGDWLYGDTPAPPPPPPPEPTSTPASSPVSDALGGLINSVLSAGNTYGEDQAKRLDFLGDIGNAALQGGNVLDAASAPFRAAGYEAGRFLDAAGKPIQDAGAIAAGGPNARIPDPPPSVAYSDKLGREPIGDGFIPQAIGTVGDALGRPQQALFGAMREGQKMGSEGPIGLIPDVGRLGYAAKAAWDAPADQHIGFGDVIDQGIQTALTKVEHELVADPTNATLLKTRDELRRSQRVRETSFGSALGTAGDVGVDPLNVMPFEIVGGMVRATPFLNKIKPLANIGIAHKADRLDEMGHFVNTIAFDTPEKIADAVSHFERPISGPLETGLRKARVPDQYNPFARSDRSTKNVDLTSASYAVELARGSGLTPEEVLKVASGEAEEAALSTVATNKLREMHGPIEAAIKDTAKARASITSLTPQIEAKLSFQDRLRWDMAVENGDTAIMARVVQDALPGSEEANALATAAKALPSTKSDDPLNEAIRIYTRQKYGATALSNTDQILRNVQAAFKQGYLVGSPSYYLNNMVDNVGKSIIEGLGPFGGLREARTRVGQYTDGVQHPRYQDAGAGTMDVERQAGEALGWEKVPGFGKVVRAVGDKGQELEKVSNRNIIDRVTIEAIDHARPLFASKAQTFLDTAIKSADPQTAETLTRINTYLQAKLASPVGFSPKTLARDINDILNQGYTPAGWRTPPPAAMPVNGHVARVEQELAKLDRLVTAGVPAEKIQAETTRTFDAARRAVRAEAAAAKAGVDIDSIFTDAVYGPLAPLEAIVRDNRVTRTAYSNFWKDFQATGNARGVADALVEFREAEVRGIALDELMRTKEIALKADAQAARSAGDEATANEILSRIAYGWNNVRAVEKQMIDKARTQLKKASPTATPASPEDLRILQGIRDDVLAAKNTVLANRQVSKAAREAGPYLPPAQYEAIDKNSLGKRDSSLVVAIDAALAKMEQHGLITRTGEAAPTPAAAPAPGDWITEAKARYVAQADKLGVADEIESLSAQGLVAKQIWVKIRDRVPGLDLSDGTALIRSVRDARGIPSQMDQAEWQTWLSKRNQTPGGSPLLPASSEDAAREMGDILARGTLTAPTPTLTDRLSAIPKGQAAGAVGGAALGYTGTDPDAPWQDKVLRTTAGGLVGAALGKKADSFGGKPPVGPLPDLNVVSNRVAPDVADHAYQTTKTLDAEIAARATEKAAAIEEGLNAWEKSALDGISRGLPTAVGAATPPARAAANTIVRAWADTIDMARGQGARESARILFDYENGRTKLDEVLSYLFPFTIWQTRNIPYYIDALVRNPKLGVRMSRYLQMTEQKRTEMGAPVRFMGMYPVGDSGTFLNGFNTALTSGQNLAAIAAATDRKAKADAYGDETEKATAQREMLETISGLSLYQWLETPLNAIAGGPLTSPLPQVPGYKVGDALGVNQFPYTPNKVIEGQLASGRAYQAHEAAPVQNDVKLQERAEQVVRRQMADGTISAEDAYRALLSDKRADPANTIFQKAVEVARQELYGPSATRSLIPVGSVAKTWSPEDMAVADARKQQSAAYDLGTQVTRGGPMDWYTKTQTPNFKDTNASRILDASRLPYIDQDLEKQVRADLAHYYALPEGEDSNGVNQRTAFLQSGRTYPDPSDTRTYNPSPLELYFAFKGDRAKPESEMEQFLAWAASPTPKATTAASAIGAGNTMPSAGSGAAPGSPNNGQGDKTSDPAAETVATTDDLPRYGDDTYKGAGQHTRGGLYSPTDPADLAAYTQHHNFTPAQEAAYLRNILTYQKSLAWQDLYARPQAEQDRFWNYNKTPGEKRAAIAAKDPGIVPLFDAVWAEYKTNIGQPQSWLAKDFSAFKKEMGFSEDETQDGTAEQEFVKRILADQWPLAGPTTATTTNAIPATPATTVVPSEPAVPGTLGGTSRGSRNSPILPATEGAYAGAPLAGDLPRYDTSYRGSGPTTRGGLYIATDAADLTRYAQHYNLTPAQQERYLASALEYQSQNVVWADKNALPAQAQADFEAYNSTPAANRPAYEASHPGIKELSARVWEGYYTNLARPEAWLAKDFSDFKDKLDLKGPEGEARLKASNATAEQVYAYYIQSGKWVPGGGTASTPGASITPVPTSTPAAAVAVGAGATPGPSDTKVRTEARVVAQLVESGMSEADARTLVAQGMGGFTQDPGPTRTQNPQIRPEAESYRAIVARYFPADQVDNALAVMSLESQGRAGAHNTNGEDSRGLYQINVGPGANPSLASSNLFDPETNIRVAAQMYQERGWQPWSAARSLGMPGTTPLPGQSPTAAPAQAITAAVSAAGATETPAPIVSNPETANPNIVQQYDEWTNLRRERGEDPNAWEDFRKHAIAIGAPDPGPILSAAPAGNTRNVNTNMPQDLTPDQFQLGRDGTLSKDDAASFCGPASAIAFARAMGRNPTVEEARTLAIQVGWTPEKGMAGMTSEAELLKRMGIPVRLDTSGNWNNINQVLDQGGMVIVSNRLHYFTISGRDQKTGAYYVGTSGKVYQGGSDWMTSAQIERRAEIYGAIYLDASELQKVSLPAAPPAIPAAGGNTIIPNTISGDTVTADSPTATDSGRYLGGPLQGDIPRFDTTYTGPGRQSAGGVYIPADPTDYVKYVAHHNLTPDQQVIYLSALKGESDKGAWAWLDSYGPEARNLAFGYNSTPKAGRAAIEAQYPGIKEFTKQAFVEYEKFVASPDGWLVRDFRAFKKAFQTEERAPELAAAGVTDEQLYYAAVIQGQWQLGQGAGAGGGGIPSGYASSGSSSNGGGGGYSGGGGGYSGGNSAPAQPAPSSKTDAEFELMKLHLSSILDDLDRGSLTAQNDTILRAFWKKYHPDIEWTKFLRYFRETYSYLAKRTPPSQKPISARPVPPDKTGAGAPPPYQKNQSFQKLAAAFGI